MVRDDRVWCDVNLAIYGVNSKIFVKKYTFLARDIKREIGQILSDQESHTIRAQT